MAMANPMAMNMPPMGMGTNGQNQNGDQCCETLDVPDSSVGLIIGRGGEQIQNIQNTSGCKVQMAPESGNGLFNAYLADNATGTKAKSMILSVIDRAGTRPPPGVGGGMPGMGRGMAAPPGGNMMFNGAGGEFGGMGGRSVTHEMQIPGHKCGLVIGKGGETIKNLQEQNGVKMVMIQDSQESGPNSKPLKITGDPQKVEAARQMVEEILNRDDGQRGPPGAGGAAGGGGFYGGGGPMNRNTGEVIVPRTSVGMIIGKGGENIKKMAAESGARIQFKNDEDPNANERTAVIQGTFEQIQRATQLITELVHRSMTDGHQETFYMHVPSNKTGLVIGRGGETIKAINGESGAHVELSRDEQQNSNEKVFIIKGTPYQIHVAQHLIRIKVGDIAQGTPVPPFAGGPAPAASSSATGQFGGQFQGPGAPGYPGQMAANQWPPAGQYAGGTQAPAAGQNDPNAAAWAQYYAQQQQQQQMQPQAAAATQPQQGGANFASAYTNAAQPQQPQAAAGQNAQPNAAGGQPDYSLQWIEYYRSMGLYDQAAMIEQNRAAAAGGQQGQAQGAPRPAQPQQQPQQYGGYQAAGQPGGAATVVSAGSGQFGGGFTSGQPVGAPAGAGQYYQQQQHY